MSEAFRRPESTICFLRFVLRHHERGVQRRGRVEHGRRLLGLLALEHRVGGLGRRGRDDLDRLVDRVVLVAVDDPLDRGELGVVARHGRDRLDAGGLERRDGAAAGAVVGRDHARDLAAELRDLARRPVLRLGRRPVRRVELGQLLDPARVDRRVDALLDQARGRVGRRAVDLQDPALLGASSA